MGFQFNRKADIYRREEGLVRSARFNVSENQADRSMTGPDDCRKSCKSRTEVIGISNAVVAMLTMLLVFQTFAWSTAVAITVCLVEEEHYNVTFNSSQILTAVHEIDTEQSPEPADPEVDVTVVRYVVSEAQFSEFAQNACVILNSSCSGVVTLASCNQTQFMDNWAMEHIVPHVSVLRKHCPLTTSEDSNYMADIRRQGEMLQQLLVYLGWTQVAMLADSRDMESSASAELVKQLSDVYIGSLLFRLFDHLHEGKADNGSQVHVRHVQDQLRIVKESHFKNILVTAPCNSSSLILQKAETIGLLSKDHYWVIALPSKSCPGLLSGITVNITNILFVHPVHVCTEGTKLCHHYKGSRPILVDTATVAGAMATLVKAAEAVKRGQNGSENSSICENSPSVLPGRSAVIKSLEEEDVSANWIANSTIPNQSQEGVPDPCLKAYAKSPYADDVLKCARAQNAQRRPFVQAAAFDIYSTEVGKPEDVVRVGQWTEDTGLELTEKQLYRNTFRNFDYRTLRVGTQEAKPFVQKISNTSEFEGFCIDILNELANALKFHYVFVEPSDGEWGAPKGDNSGNWTGIVQQVLTKKVDIGVGPFTITSIRAEVIDFTKPFIEDGVGILTKRPNSNAKNMFKMFTPLTPLVWAAVAGSVVVVTLCLYTIERLSPFSARNLKGDRKLGMLGCAWLIYGSYMEQGGDPHPRSVSARLLVGFWWLFTILMTSTYTANLAAFLTVTIEDSPINSLSALAHSSELKPLVKQGSNVQTLFKEADGGIYEAIWHKMAGMPVVKSNEEALKYVLTGSYAYMTDASQLEYIMLKDCTTYSMAKELFNTGGFGFILPEDSPYMDIINYNIMKMQEAGLMDKWRQKWWSSPDPCSSSGRTSAAKELDWPSLSGLFYIFIGVSSLSIIFRLFEYWFHSDKLQHFWNRLKTMFRQATFADNKEAYCTCSVELDNYKANCSVCQSGSNLRSKKSTKCATTLRPTSADLPVPESTGVEGERKSSLGNISAVCDGSMINDGFSRSPEFQDFDSANTFWGHSVQRRPALRSSFKTGESPYL